MSRNLKKMSQHSHHPPSFWMFTVLLVCRRYNTHSKQLSGSIALLHFFSLSHTVKKETVWTALLIVQRVWARQKEALACWTHPSYPWPSVAVVPVNRLTSLLRHYMRESVLYKNTVWSSGCFRSYFLIVKWEYVKCDRGKWKNYMGSLLQMSCKVTILVTPLAHSS